MNLILLSFFVRDHIPLEQGLRQILIELLVELFKVRDHIPLEQGLRPVMRDWQISLVRSETIFH